MTYRDLIKKFEPYADEEVSMITCMGTVRFYPVSDGNEEIVSLAYVDEDPYPAYECE